MFTTRFSKRALLFYALLLPVLKLAAQAGPAGVNTGIGAWWRADAGASGTSWTDQSGNTRTLAQGVAAARPVFVNNAINFQPALDFDANDFMSSASVFGTGSTQNVAIFAAVQAEDPGVGGRICGELTSNGYGVGIHFPWTDNNMYWDAPYGYRVNGNWQGSFNTPYVLSTTKTPNAMYAYSNHKTIASGTAGYPSAVPGNNSSFTMGLIQNWGYFGGKISELIVYKNSATLTAIDRQKIESYLALKYGITLDQASAYNYLASDGTTIMWNATANATWNKNIFGIGRDDVSGLHQKQSRPAIATARILSIALGNSIAATNAANAGMITTNKTFLVFGDNGGNTRLDVPVTNPSIEKIMARTWRVQKSATWTDQVITLNAGATYANKYIVISNTSSSFATITNTVQFDINGNATFNSSLLPDGAYMTIGQAPTGPGGVAGNLRVWLDGNKGVYQLGGTTPAMDGAAADQWNDQSQSATGDLFRSTGSNGGTVTYKANGINYNGALELTNVAMRGYVNTAITSPNISSFAAVKSPSVTDGHRYYVLYSNASGGYDYNTNLESIVFGLSGANVQSHRGAWENPALTSNKNATMVMTSLTTPTSHSLNLNGKQGIPAAYAKGNFSINQYFVGGGYAAGWCCGSATTERYGEVITFDRALTALETRKVESYLALKWGSSLDQTVVTDYVASDWNGTTGTKMWTNDNDGYNRKIFGIGRDDNGQLYQKQSTSSDTNNVFAVAMGTTFPDNNAANNNTIGTDKTFLSFACNGMSSATNAAVTGLTNTTTRMSRIWKVDKSATWTDANITIQTNGTTAKYLLISSDANFGAGDTEYQLDGNGQVTINSGLLQHGYYLTFGNKAMGPANVSSGIMLWMDARTANTGAMVPGTGWQDNSGSGKDFTVVAGAPTRYDSVNFNRYINFNGSSYIRSAAPFVNTMTAGETFVVTRSRSNSNNGNPYDFGAGPNARASHLVWGNNCEYNGFGTTQRIGYNSVANTICEGKAGVASIVGTRYPNINRWNLHNTYAATGSWGTAMNGLFKATTNTNTVSFALAAGNEHIGAVSGTIYTGDIAEVILYNRKLSTTERQQVNSYLGLKYGITIDQSTPQNYLASDGTTIMWQNDGDGYNMRISGLGRDNATYLHQKLGTNQDTGTIWTVGLGDVIAGVNNFNNAASINNDKTFFTFADNNQPAQYTAGIAGTNVNVRMGRVWKVDKSAGWTDQNITFSAGASYGSNKYLLISTSATFPTITQELLLDVNGNVTINSSLLPANAYFTIGTKIIGPAGNNVGVAAWWRADSGAASAVWNDFSGNDKTAVQGTGASQPVVDAGNIINFNSAMRFDGSNDHLIAPSLFANGMSNVTIFMAGTAATAHNGCAFAELSSNSNAYYLNFFPHWSNSWSYWDAPYGYRVQNASGVTVNRPYVWSMQRTPAVMNLWRNVTTVGTFATPMSNFNGVSNFYIGNLQSLANPLNGRIAELIVYNNSAAMTANQRRAIETYLSLKYGTSLDSTQGNYLAYDSTVIWNQTANAGFRWRVTGIGRDDRSVLSQKQSRNYDTASAGFATMGLTNIEATNALNTTAFSADKSYLVWGDNNASGISTTTIAGATVTPANPTLFNGLTGCAALARFNKIYRVQKTGTVAPVQVKINSTGLQVGKLASDYYLAINNTNAFNSGTVQQLIQATAYDKTTRVITFDNVTFNDGDYFTVVGKKVQAPANIVSGIKLWVKAEDGISMADSIRVSRWDDQSPANSNLVQAVTANQPTTSGSTNLMNFNPTVKFDGNDALSGKSLLGAVTSPGATFFTVSSQNAVVNTAIFNEVSAVGGSLNLHATWGDNNIYWDPPVNNNRLNYNVGNITGQNILWSGYSNPVAAAANRQFIYRNGQSLGTGGSGTTALTGNNSPFYLGGGSNAGGYNGRIGEVIIYTSPLAAADMQKIHSYLSVKWGLSLDQTTNTNYYASDWNGTTGTVLWNAAANSAYKYRVTGIGRDDCSDLNQLQSMNNDTASKGYVTMGRGTISTSNPGNPNTFATDRSYILWGDNNATGVVGSAITTDGTTTIPNSNACVALRRMAKVFKVAVTNAPGAAQVQFNVNGLPLGKKAADFYLAIDNAATFSGTTVAKLVAASAYTNGVVTFDNVTFTDGQYFTLLGQKSGAPANVTAGIATWLKAEDGITLNAGKVSLWEDQSPGGRNAVQATAANQPAYVTSGAALANFNPVVLPSGTQQMAFSSTIPQSNMKIFAVGAPYTATGNWRTLFRGNTNDHHMMIQNGSTVFGYYDNAFGTAFKSSTLTTTGVPQLFGMQLSYPGTGTVQTAVPSVNGKNGTTLTNITNAGGADQFLNWQNGQPWGAISEVVMYNSATMPATDVQKIQSYLALKYGITLDQTTPTNYISSNGNVVWNAAVGANAAYSNRVTGISRDDCSDLEQTQSRNVDTTSAGFVTMSLGDLYPTVTDNPNHFGNDKSFVVWGDDNVAGMGSVAITGDGTTILPQTGTCTQFRRLGKTFKVSSINNDVAGSNSGIQVSVNTRTLNFGGSTSGIYLAVNSSSNFTGTVTKLIPASTFANNTYTFEDVTLNDGDYFTVIGSAVSGPGNVISGLDVWVRADAGVTLNGATVSKWADLGTNGNDLTQATAANQPTYVGASNNNFNPSVSFNGTGVMNIPFTILKGTLETAHSIFGVLNSTTAVDQSWLTIWNGSNLADGVWGTAGGVAIDQQPAGSSQPGAAGAGVVAGMPVINGTIYNGDGVAGGFTTYRNGRSSGTQAANNVANGTINLAQLGGMNAQVPEMIIFNRQLAAYEKAKVESYLSIKYGVSLDQTSPQSYYASDWNGTTGTILWNGTTNAAYKNRVTGIGRDDCSNLSQKQSRNSDTTTAVNLIIGHTDIAGTNAGNTNEFSADKSFEVWGDDNGSVAFNTAVSGVPAGTTVNYTMGRVWKVQETGTVGPVRIAIPYNRVANPAEAYLLVNTNAAGSTFGSSSTPYALNVVNINGQNYYAADVNLADGDYFTFASNIKSPGGVAKTSLWLRPDYGTSSTVDGTSVNEWLDYAAQLNNATQAGAANQPLYSNNAVDNINFNPAMKFNGTSQYMSLDGTKLPLGTAPRALVGVGVPSSITGAFKYIIAYGAGTTSQGQGLANSNGTGYYAGYSNDITSAALWQVGVPNEIMGRWRGTGGVATMYSKNKLIAGPTAKTWNTTSDNARIGLSAFASEYWAGTIGDVMVFNDSLTTTERQRVSTYLAIKYGYTLDQTTPTDYIAADGTTKVWDNTVGGVYKKNIAGIGRDDVEGLSQIQSKSVNKGLQVAIANTAFANDNLSNGNAFTTNNSYLTWGDDSAATTYITAVGGANPVANTRMARLWKVQKTGTVGSVQVAIPYNAIANPSASYLIRSTDATIDATDDFVKMDSIRINGALYYAANTTFGSGEIFTFGSNLKLPGGVPGVSLWLRPDYGTDVATDNTPISEWLDGAGSVNHATQGAAANQPSFRNNAADNVNFNPIVKFDGTTDMMDVDINRLPLGNTARTLIGVGKPSLLGATNRYLVSWGTGATSQGCAIGAFTAGQGAMIGYSDDLTTSGAHWQVNNTNVLMGTWAGGTLQPANLYSRNKLIAGPSNRSWNTTTTSGARIGNSVYPGTQPEYWNGSAGDIIVYPIALSASQRLRVESYLAVKYGYSLDTTAHSNYLASDSSVTWTYNGAYRNRVTGIGRDDLTALDQRQSRNLDTTSPGFVTMGLGSVAALNSDNVTNFNTDRSFLMWADDGVAGKTLTTITGDGVTSLPNSGPCADYVRMAKTYQVQRTNFTQPVQVQVNLNGLTIGKLLNDYYLAIHTAPTMTGTISKLVPATSITNGVVTFDDVDFATAGSYFTVIGQKVQAPASIQSANLKLWLKADDGINLNGTAVQQWDDNSASLNNAVQAAAANQPAYGTTYINFNPAVTLNGTSSRMSLSSPVFGTGNLSYTTFGVVNANTVSGFHYWMSDGTATANTAVGFGHNGATMSSLNWGNPYNAGTVAAGTTYLESFTRNSATLARVNILNGKFAGSVSTGVLNKTNTLASIGSNPNSAEFWSGQIGEVIAYEGLLTAAEQRKINSYLSVKWGITMADGDSSYLASDGTVIWNAASNATYKNRITGIGQDLCYDLIQRQSRNQATGSLLTMGLNSIETTNAENDGIFGADKSYLLVGDNNGATAEQTTDLPSVYVTGSKRVGREWKASTTGIAPVNLEMKFDLSTVTPALAGTLTAADMELIIDNDGDGDFTTGTTTIVPASDLASNVVTFNGVSLGSGVVFTVVTKAQKVTALTVDVKVMLQGPMGATDMTRDLNDLNILPLQQPYNDVPFNYAGAEMVSSMPVNITDWVLVELRNSGDMGNVIATRAGLLTTSGKITDVDGTSALSFTGATPGNYYVAVKHRNHLPVVAANTINLDGVATGSYDFTTSLAQAANPFGDPAQMVLKNGKWCMWTGDVNRELFIDGSDKGLINFNITQNLDETYNPFDINLDGYVDGTDKGLLNANLSAAPNSMLINY